MYEQRHSAMAARHTIAAMGVNVDAMSRPRILGGSARGRELETPRSGTRPTPAKVRQAVFDSLQFRTGRFLDLFSGSGAMGLEAASRGWDVTSVELALPAAEVIRSNARRLGLRLQVVQADALDYVKNSGGFDVLFASPPYDVPGFMDWFPQIVAAGPVAPGGTYLFQHPSRDRLDPLSLPGWVTVRTRVYGSNTVSVIEVPEPV